MSILGHFLCERGHSRYVLSEEYFRRVISELSYIQNNIGHCIFRVGYVCKIIVFELDDKYNPYRYASNIILSGDMSEKSFCT